MLTNWKIRSKITLLAAILMFFILLIGGVGYSNLAKANKDMETMYKDRLLAIQQLDENQVHARAVEADIYYTILSTNNLQEQQAKLEDIRTRVEKFNENLRKYKQTKLDPFEIKNLKTMESNLDEYRKGREAVLSLALAGRGEEAKIAYSHIKSVAENFQKDLVDLEEYNVKVADEIHTRNNVQYSNTMRVFIALFIIALIFSIGATWFISKIISMPISLAINHIEEVAAYNISRDVPPLFMERKDEIGNLAKAVQKIEENLRNLLTNIDNTSEQVSSSAEELMAMSKQAVTAAEEVAKTIEEIAKGATDQAQSTNEGSEKLTHLGNLIEEDKTHIQVLTHISDRVKELVSQGLDIINRLSVKTDESSDATKRVYGSIKQTNESSSKIGEASNLIASIAEQTNLLALNAAIEAARAGEHGKGFAVVAEEIRKLAEQSTKSTQTIDDMVKDLQINSAEAVRTMEKFETILKEQVENVELTESKYKEISEAIEKAAEAVETINKAGKLMEEKKKEVLDTIQTLSAVAEENAASTEEASASIEEQTASMNQIAHSSSKLSQLTQKLQTLIEKFKI